MTRDEIKRKWSIQFMELKARAYSRILIILSSAFVGTFELYIEHILPSQFHSSRATTSNLSANSYTSSSSSYQ